MPADLPGRHHYSLLEDGPARDDLRGPRGRPDRRLPHPPQAPAAFVQHQGPDRARRGRADHGCGAQVIGHAAVKLDRLQADLDALAEFREPDPGPWTRRVFSDAYLRSREWLAGRMREAGLKVSRDAAGNLIGVLPGASPALVTGSHTDTVADGGRFDGPLGVLAAIEVARCVRDGGLALRHELRAVDFLGEEPNEFGVSCVGSRAVAGNLSGEHLALRDASGRTLADAIATAGGDPARIRQAAWAMGDVRAFVELHIEQGPVLEGAGIPIGIVSGIAGIERLQLTFEG